MILFEKLLIKVFLIMRCCKTRGGSRSEVLTTEYYAIGCTFQDSERKSFKNFAMNASDTLEDWCSSQAWNTQLNLKLAAG